MIRIVDKENCCGCRACENACPVRCIAMRADEEGFLYPEADAVRCTECGLCERVCPVLSRRETGRPMTVYAAKSCDEATRLASSSGGMFSLLAGRVLAAGGVVFGARFDGDWRVVHDGAETPEALTALRGSKYVQSDMGDTFSRVKALLREGRKVLFSGTPCQVAGLQNFLRCPDPNLLAVDVACHGAPSPLVWRAWLEERFGGRCERIGAIGFRTKPEGWKRFHFCVTGRDGVPMLDQAFPENGYMRGFLNDLYLRPSCYRCPVRSFRSGSDLTLADFWGVERLHAAFDDDRGTSLVTVNTARGAEAFAEVGADRIETSYADALRGNPVLERSVACPELRKTFFAAFQTTTDLDGLIRRLTRPGLYRRARALAGRIYRRLWKRRKR